MKSKQEIEKLVEKHFPAPEFREHQKDTIVKMVVGFVNRDCDVVALDAPTGSGKSLILYTVAKVLEDIDNVSETVKSKRESFNLGLTDSSIPEPIGCGTFATTPLNSLVDQIDDDEFISPNVITLKGRNNYECIHEEDKGERVDQAICQRDDSFECEVKESCHYYGRKYNALQHPTVYTNMSYLMAEGMIPGGSQGTFSNRDNLIVDECQKIEDFAMSFISFTVSKRTVPDEVWSNIQIPQEWNTSWAKSDEHIENSMDFLVSWLEEEVLTATIDMLNFLGSQTLTSKSQSKDEEKLEQFKVRVENFIEDVKENDWVAQLDVDINKNKSNSPKIIFEPVTIGRFLKNLLWSRADRIILSSATIPGDNWMSEIGLQGKKVGKVEVPSTFPVENRPIITSESVGKMTYKERDDTAWPMMKKIIQLAHYHDGKGMIHCRSYGIRDMLKRTASNNSPAVIQVPSGEDGEFEAKEINTRKWFQENVMLQDKMDREGSLKKWQESDKQVFFSVAMDEGVSLDDDACRWQVLGKTLYKSMNNKRVKHRVQKMNDWDWYNRHAAVQIAQAYGRAVRGPDDWAYFYILDDSAVGLIDRNSHLFPDWFLEAME